MLAPKLRHAASREAGFTLIELLVVILIVGILAAIAVPLFLNQRQKAYSADAKEIARTAQTAEEVAYTEGQAYVSQAAGAGPSGSLSKIEAALVSPSVVCPAQPPYDEDACGLRAIGSLNAYQVSVASRTGVVFTVTRAPDGTITRTCDVSAAIAGGGGCEGVAGGVGSW